MALIALDRLKSILRYDSALGLFFWRVAISQSIKSGRVAGSVNRRGYRIIQVDHRLYPAHRLAWFYVTGEWPFDQIDHINGKRDDNKFSNLREASNTLNAQNQLRARADSTTGLMGVKPHLGKFWARIQFGGKRHSLGVFDTAEQAHAVYLAAKRIHHEGCTL